MACTPKPIRRLKKKTLLKPSEVRRFIKAIERGEEVQKLPYFKLFLPGPYR